MRAFRLPRLAAAAALCAAVAACSSGPAPTTFDLTAPSQRVGGQVGAQVAVAEPVTIQTYEADRIIVKDAAGTVSFLPGAQWADRLPRLVQARLIQTFENASRLRAVSRPSDRITADYQLLSEIRAFQIDAGTGEAVVEITVKAVEDRTGRVAAARIFRARSPVGAIDAGNAAQALDKALATVLLDIVRFVGASSAAAPRSA